MDIEFIDSIVNVSTFSNQHCSYDLSIFEYSLLLYRSLILENEYMPESRSLLYKTLRCSSSADSKWKWQTLHKSYMDLCIEIAFFTTATHAGLEQYQMSAFKLWIPVLNLCISDLYNIEFTSNLSQIVFSFIFYDYSSSHSSVPNIKWYEFDGDCNEDGNVNKEEQNKYKNVNLNAKYASQLVFSEDGQTVDFRNSRTDWLLLKSKHKINESQRPIRFIHCYITGKGDEMWIGLHGERKRIGSMTISRSRKSLEYYGGRTSCIQKYGGLKNDLCSNPYSFYETDCTDCNHGGIQGYNTVVHPLDSYSAGDWISIYVDFTIIVGMQTKPLIVFYKNGIEIYRSQEEHQIFEQLMNGELFFGAEVDKAEDGFYVEESVASAAFIASLAQCQ